MRTERPAKKESVWERTRHQNLFRYLPSGTIFARLKISGKQVTKSLKTPSLELAKNKLAELERNERAVADDRRRGKMLIGEALDEYLQTRKHDATLKPRTKAYDEQQVVALLKTWPGLRDLDARRISKEDCERWAAKFAEEYAPSGYNHTLAILKHTLERAVERGVRHDNPAKKLKRQGERPKKLTLPTQDQFVAFIKEIETGGSGKSQPCADLVRFLAYSGCRKMEAAHVTWADISFDKGTMGEKTLGTRLGKSSAHGRELIELHKRVYPAYWDSRALSGQHSLCCFAGRQVQSEMKCKSYKDAVVTRDVPEHRLKRGEIVKLVDATDICPLDRRGFSIYRTRSGRWFNLIGGL